MLSFRCLALAVSLSALLAMGERSEAAPHALNLAGGSLTLEDNAGTVSLSQIEARSQDQNCAWIATEPPIPLWTLVVKDPEGERHSLTPSSGPAQAREISKDEIEFSWRGLEPGDVSVMVTVSTRGADSLWSLEADVGKKTFALWDATFPEVGPIANVSQVHSITPRGWGVLKKDLMTHDLDEGVYPSASRAMPFVAVSDSTTGLYLGIEDDQGYPLRLFVGHSEDAEAVTLGLRHEIEDMGRTHYYKTPYSIVLTPYAGDWYEAARLYRAAALETPWGSVPPVADRKDIPQWMKDLDLWYIGACHDDASAAQVLDFAKTFGVPTAAHIYNWHEIPFDDHYPEYFPAKPGFAQAVAKVQAAGVPVMPYINGRLWDPATDSWTAEEAAKACSLDAQGKPYVEVYGSKVPLSPMCPSTPLWKGKVTQLVDRLVHEVGVKAVYIDQISAAAAKRCFAENHGHPLGGGTYWIQGYRDLLTSCRALLAPDNALTTEENADPWNDQLHAFLMVNTNPEGGEMVPLYPAVYGGRVISFGFQYIHGDDFTKRYPLRLKFARTLVFGSQLGWVGPQILDPKFKTEAEFLKRLCLARHASRDAFQYGELLAPPEMEGGGTVSWTDEEDASKQVTQPAVLASLWLTPEGTRKLALVNVADEDQKVLLGLDGRHLGSVKGDVLGLHPVLEGAEVGLKRQEGGRFTAAVSIPAGQVVVLEVKGE